MYRAPDRLYKIQKTDKIKNVNYAPDRGKEYRAPD
jgi:hypothetical protein